MNRIPLHGRWRMYWVGLLAVLAALLLLLTLQYLWLNRLREVSAIAHRATLVNAMEAVTSEIEFFYRSSGERLLNISAELFLEDRLESVGKHWADRPLAGIRRLYLADFTRQEFGNFLAFQPDSGRLTTPLASEESLAMIVASSPWQIRRYRGVKGGARGLQVDENDPKHRTVLNVIAAEGQVLGLAGMILDETYFRERLLPEIVEKTLRSFFPGVSPADLGFAALDGEGELALGQPLESSRWAVATASPGFVFADWTLSIYWLGGSPESWARASTVLNILFSVLLALVIIGGLLLSLRTASRAMRLSEMKSDFVSNVSHELRTPLASIRVYAEFLRLGRARSEERVREYGETIEAESRRLSRLIDNILDFSRIETGRKSYSFRDVDLTVLVQETLAAFRQRAQTDGFELAYTAPAAPLPVIAADADAIGQALANLLDNAMKYSGESRWIGVRLEREGDEALIEVADRGIGIPGEERERIFDRFHRASRGPVHDVKGSGLGLAIVHHVMDAHGGRVTVTSEPGKGSAFTLRLPLAARPRTPAGS